MPIYEYICLDCSSRFDALRSMNNADTPIACDQCGSQHTSRLLSIFYAQSGGRAVSGTSTGGCAGCSGHSCSTCGVN